MVEDRFRELAPLSLTNAPKQRDELSTSDAQISSFTVSGDDDYFRTNGARHRVSPIAKLNETHLHISNGDQSAAHIDSSVHEPRRLDSQSLHTNTSKSDA